MDQASARAQRQAQLAFRMERVADALAPDEQVLDHSIARLDRTKSGKGLKIEGFLVVTDRQLIFQTPTFRRSVPYTDVRYAEQKGRLSPVKTVRLFLADDEAVDFAVGKTFAKSILGVVNRHA